MKVVLLCLAAIALAGCDESVESRAGIGVSLGPNGVSVAPSAGVVIGNVGVSVSP